MKAAQDVAARKHRVCAVHEKQNITPKSTPHSDPPLLATIYLPAVITTQLNQVN